MTRNTSRERASSDCNCRANRGFVIVCLASFIGKDIIPSQQDATAAQTTRKALFLCVPTRTGATSPAHCKGPEETIMRPSKRQPDEMRAISFERGVSKHAEGSCLVKF